MVFVGCSVIWRSLPGLRGIRCSVTNRIFTIFVNVGRNVVCVQRVCRCGPQISRPSSLAMIFVFVQTWMYSGGHWRSSS
uniref:Putative secreted protein n=1 Tax=Ixodes ricinus TaxID=34613 RepID=A0A6B0U5U0_IXORI